MMAGGRIAGARLPGRNTSRRGGIRELGAGAGIPAVQKKEVHRQCPVRLQHMSMAPPARTGGIQGDGAGQNPLGSAAGSTRGAARYESAPGDRRGWRDCSGPYHWVPAVPLKHYGRPPSRQHWHMQSIRRKTPGTVRYPPPFNF